MSNIRQQLHGVGAGMNSGRASVTSNSSVGQRGGSRASLNGPLHSSDAKSLVRVALKNQRRGEKIAGAGLCALGGKGVPA